MDLCVSLLNPSRITLFAAYLLFLTEYKDIAKQTRPLTARATVQLVVIYSKSKRNTTTQQRGGHNAMNSRDQSPEKKQRLKPPQ